MEQMYVFLCVCVCAHRGLDMKSGTDVLITLTLAVDVIATMLTLPAIILISIAYPG